MKFGFRSPTPPKKRIEIAKTWIQVVTDGVANMLKEMKTEVIAEDIASGVEHNEEKMDLILGVGDIEKFKEKYLTQMARNRNTIPCF